MDSHELRKLLDFAMADRSVEKFVKNLAYVVSYLISEQDKRQELSDKLEEHARKLSEFEKESLTMKNSLQNIRSSQERMEKQSESNGKMARNILVAVLSALILEGLRWILKK